MLNTADIAALASVLGPRVGGGQVQKIREPDATTVVLYVRRPGETVRLVLSATPGVSRIAESPTHVTTLPEPTTLGRWLRAHLSGRRLESLTVLDGERIVELRFAEGRLIAELTGRFANLIAVDPKGVIVAMATNLAAGGRDLRPKQRWQPPPLRDLGQIEAQHHDPIAVEAAAQIQLTSTKSTQDQVTRARAIRTVRKRLTRLRRNILTDVERGEHADKWLHWGELLKSQLHLAKKGQIVAQISDWYAEGAPTIEIPLEPALNPLENAQRYFKRYRKAKTGVEHAQRRLIKVDADLASLGQIEAEYPDAEGVIQALKTAGLARTRVQRRSSKGVVLPRKPYRVWLSRTGDRILVGRGGADNHALTFQIARGNDCWLHVRDCPGAHVIIPLIGGKEIHPETMLDAGALAAHHSDLRGETVVDVMYTQRKHVRAVKGASLGRVTVSGGKTLTVFDGPSRLAGMKRDG